MKLYVIDGNSLLFRAYFATSFSGNIMRTKDGFPTNAIFGFANMISKIISSLNQDDRIFVAFDFGKKTFRSELLESYKAQRKPIEEDLALQLPIARELLKAMGIFYYEQQGYEGDDIAGTVAKNASKQGIETIVYTSDKDYLQLIDQHISIYMIRKGLTDIEIMNEVTLKEKYSLRPEQIKDYKGLMGDPSDNLKGIPGIGEKTALKLIAQYDSLENIIEAMKTQKSKMAQKIIENQNDGLLCKKMATIITDMELPFTLDDLVYEGYDYNELSTFYTKYECFSLIKKLKPTDKRKSPENAHQVQIKKVNVSHFKDIPQTNIIIIDQENGSYHEAPINGFVFTKDGINYYLDFAHAKKDKDFLNYMKDENAKKITYDFKALKVALSYQQIEVNGVGFDLTLASYLLNPALSNDPLSIYGYYNVNINLNNNEPSLFENDNIKFNMAYFLEQIYQTSLNKLQEVNQISLYEEIELPLCEILANIEIEGFPVDKNYLLELSKEYKEKIDALQNQIYQYTAAPFNISSPKQLADVLFHQLNLPSLNKKESTGIEVLNYLKDLHPIVPLIIEYRKYTKLQSTYIDGLISYIHDDHKIHTIFNQALTSTGRLSSSEPNLQNIATRDEESRIIKKAFYYQDEEMLSLDYSQIELRILASMSSCTSLIETFNQGEDIHSATAMKVFNVDKDHLTSELRRKAKAVNFGIIYGISDWGLAEQISSTPAEAKKIIATFYEQYPEIKEYFSSVIEQTKTLGYSSTLYGRRRYIPEINADNFQTREFGKRAAMNASIQGTGADIIKIAMIKINKFLKENHYQTKMVLQIHDELIFKIPQNEKSFIVDQLKNIMENCVSLKVKMKVEGSLGKTWYDCK